MKRAWRHRIWFYKPQWSWDCTWIRTWAWKLWWRGGDEFDWHTLVVGFPWTGQVVIALYHCDYSRDHGRLKCLTLRQEMAAEGVDIINPNQWPVDFYGYNHLTKEYE